MPICYRAPSVNMTFDQGASPMIEFPKPKVAAAHVAPVFLDTPRTMDKACSLITEAAAHGADLIAFPESFIPAFPVWAAAQSPVLGHDLFSALARNALRMDGPEIDRLRNTARRHGIMVSMGFTEGTAASVGCLWNANVLIGADGTILNHHRKLVPTFYEKLIWANGDGWGLRVVDTRIGRIGVLICGENTNPLARFALMAQGEQIHIATYPPVWPTRATREGNYDLEQAIKIRAGGHSFEAKAFTIVTSAVYDGSARAALSTLSAEAHRILEEAPRAVSLIFGPTGMPISEVMCANEGILYANLDLAQCVEPKQFHDVVGYYNRFDVFKLRIDRTRTAPAAFEDHDMAASPTMTRSDLQEDSASISGLDAQRSKSRG